MRKYFLQFFLHAAIFLGVMYLFDWSLGENFSPWYSYVLQAALFGIFMTGYTRWKDKSANNN